MAKSVEDLVVWITGGGSGIGKAMAIEFASRKSKVVVSGRREDKLQEVAEELKESGGQVLAVVCDVTQEESIASAVAQITTTWGQLDIVVANAGFGVGGAFETISAEQWRSQMDTNVVGVASTLRQG